MFQLSLLSLSLFFFFCEIGIQELILRFTGLTGYVSVLGCRALKNKLYSLSYISDDTSSECEMQLGVFVFFKFFGLFYSEYLVKLEFMY